MARKQKKVKEEVALESADVTSVIGPKLEEPQQPMLTLNDVRIMVGVINTATERGAFKAHELSTVGRLHDTLAKFLAFYSSKQEPAVKSNADEQST